MILYHGSNIVVDQPKILQSERMLDFGEGFYTTSNREQAERWSERVSQRRNLNIQVISEYHFDVDAAISELKVRKLYNQTLFHTEKSLHYCHYIRSFQLGGASNG